MIWGSHFGYRIGRYTREQFDDFCLKRSGFTSGLRRMRCRRGNDLGPRKRPALRARAFEGRLTISVHKKHSAKELVRMRIREFC